MSKSIMEVVSETLNQALVIGVKVVGGPLRVWNGQPLWVKFTLYGVFILLAIFVAHMVYRNREEWRFREY